MGKLACHGGSFKAGSSAGMDKHNRRLSKEYENENVDLSRSHKNIFFKKPEVSLYQDLKKDVESVKAAGGRIRSDSNWFCEFVVYAPKGLDDEKTREYFQTVYDFFADKVSEKNIKSAVVHRDEVTDHMHLDFVPLVEKDGKLKLSSKEVMTRSFLFKIHDELPDRLRAKGFDVERGASTKNLTFEERKKKGRSVKRYKADAEAEREQIEKQIQNKISEKSIHEYGVNRLLEQKDELTAEIEKLKIQHNELSSQLQDALIQIQEFESLKKDFKADMRNVDEALVHIEAELQRFKNLDKIMDSVEAQISGLNDEVKAMFANKYREPYNRQKQAYRSAYEGIQARKREVNDMLDKNENWNDVQARIKAKRQAYDGSRRSDPNHKIKKDKYER